MLWWLSLGEGGTLLHDVVGINCKNGASTENQGRCQVHGLRSVC